MLMVFLLVLILSNYHFKKTQVLPSQLLEQNIINGWMDFFALCLSKEKKAPLGVRRFKELRLQGMSAGLVHSLGVRRFLELCDLNLQGSVEGILIF